MFNYFKSIKKSSKVEGVITVEQFLNKIKKGDSHLEIIKKCRKLKELKFDKEYSLSKKEELPAFTLNFLFKESRKDINILKSTGYIYLDIDNSTELDFNNHYIYSSWISLSGNGRGILVKCKNVNKSNFKYNYTLISDELNINTDYNAAKATQITVLSCDKNIYINKNSSIWKAKNIPIQKHKNISPIVDNDLGFDFAEKRYDNVEEFTKLLDFKGEEYIDYGVKVSLSKVNIYHFIYEGSRYTKLNAIAYQFRALNPKMDDEHFKQFVFNVNRHKCVPILEDSEVYQIIENILGIDENDLKPILNHQRIYFFNPEKNLTGKERKAITASLNGKKRAEKSRVKLRKALNDWNIDETGKISNKKLIEITNLSKNTISKYINEEEFKIKIQEINNLYKNKPP